MEQSAFQYCVIELISFCDLDLLTLEARSQLADLASPDFSYAHPLIIQNSSQTYLRHDLNFDCQFD